MADGWAAYAKVVRTKSEHIWGAGLFGFDGTLWGMDGLPSQNAETKSEVQKLVELIKDKEEGSAEANARLEAAQTNGFKFLGRNWACISIEPNLLVARGKGENSAQFAARITRMCFIVALADSKGTRSAAMVGAQHVGDMLEGFNM